MLTSSHTQKAKIELSNRCNLRCIYCRDDQPPIVDMPDQMFAALLDDFQERGVTSIEISGEGELLVCKGWREKCLEMLERGFRLSAITNLSKPIFERDIEILLRFENLMVSFDTAVPEDHERVRRWGKFAVLEDNVAKLRAARKHQDTEAVRLVAACVVCDYNACDLELYAQFCVTHSFDHVLFRAIDTDKNPDMVLRSVSELPPEKLVLARDAYVKASQHMEEARLTATVMPRLLEQLGLVKRADALGEEASQGTVMTRACLDPWNYTLVLADGSVYPCCHYGTIGSLKENTLTEVLEGEPNRKLRERLLSGNLDTLCATCPGRPWTDIASQETEVAAYLAMGQTLATCAQDWQQNNQKVMIYGAGEHTAMLLGQPPMKRVHIMGLIDKNPRLKGLVRFGYSVHSPDALMDLNPDVILISSRAFEQQIALELQERGIPAEKIQRLYA